MSLRSLIDSSRFGIAVGKVQIKSCTEIQSYLDCSRAEGLDLLIARSAADNFVTVHKLEEAGFRLMDTLLYFRRPLAKPSPQAAGFIRIARESDIDSLVAVAKVSFRDYPNHYRADRRLPRELTDAIYPDWAHQSLLDQPTVADQVLVAEIDGEIAGFGTLKFVGDVAEGPLFGVAPAFRGRGIYRALLLAAVYNAREAGCVVMEYSTQLTNIAAQRTIAPLGFSIDRSIYTFHRWFDSN